MTQPASHSNKWTTPALIIIAAAVLLAVVLLVKPAGESPSLEELAAMMEKADAPEVQSYRMTWSGTGSDGNEASELQQEGAFAAPDRYYFKLTEGGAANEFITIGGTQYVQGDRFSPNLTIAFTNSASRFLTHEFVLDSLEALVEPEALATEGIDGTECFHYRGELDLERQFQEMLASVNTTRPGHEEQLEFMETEFERIRQSTIEYEIWIGKEDLLARQIKYSGRVPSENEGEWDTSDATIQIYDINQPVTIEAPLDDSGKLLPGWQLADSSDSNEQVFSRNIVSSTGSQEGYDDWEHQEVTYTITITNNSDETVRDVRVTINTRLLEREDKPLVAAEPKTPADVIAPGESRTFHARIPFNASGYTKEDILKLQDVTTFLVDYIGEDGQERTQLIYPDAPYPTTVPPPLPVITHTPIPAKDMPTPIIWAEEEAPDDIMPAPGMGPTYRANIFSIGDDGIRIENPWPPVELSSAELGDGSETASISFREYIDTDAGETRNNIIKATISGGEIDSIGSLSLYADDIPAGITLTVVSEWSGPFSRAAILAIEIAPDVATGNYPLEIGLLINDKDYGTVPCTIRVITESPKGENYEN